MKDTLNRSQRRKLENFNKIINASHKVFAKKGLFRATFDEISQVADVGKGTVYSHFRNKIHLVAYLTKQGINDLLSYCEKQTGRIKDPQEKIVKLVSAHFTFFARRKALFNILFFIRGALHQDFENRYTKEIHSQYEKYIHFLADTINYGINKGAFRFCDALSQAYILEGIIIGFISQWMVNRKKEPFKDKAERVAETFLHGIAKANEGKKHNHQGS